MARTINANTIIVAVNNFSKLSSADRTAATNWMTAITAQIVAGTATIERNTVFRYPPKGGKVVHANTVDLALSDYTRLSASDKTAATDWLTAIIAQIVALGAGLKNRQRYIYPPK